MGRTWGLAHRVNTLDRIRSILLAAATLAAVVGVGWGVWEWAHRSQAEARERALQVALQDTTAALHAATTARQAAADTARRAVDAADRAHARTEAVLAERAAAPHVGVVDSGHVVVLGPGEHTGQVVAVSPEVARQLTRDSTLIASLLFERDTAFRAIATLKTLAAADSTEREATEALVRVSAAAWGMERDRLRSGTRKWKVISAALAVIVIVRK